MCTQLLELPSGQNRAECVLPEYIESNPMLDSGLQLPDDEGSLRLLQQLYDENECGISLAAFNMPQHVLSRSGLKQLILRYLQEPDQSTNSEINNDVIDVQAARYGGDEFILFLRVKHEGAIYSFYQLCDVSDFALASQVDDFGINGNILAKIVAKTIQESVSEFLSRNRGDNDFKNSPSLTAFNIAEQSFTEIFTAIKDRLSEIPYLYKVDNSIISQSIKMPVPETHTIVEMFSDIPNYTENELLDISDGDFLLYLRYEMLLMGSLPTYQEIDGVYSPCNDKAAKNRKRSEVLARIKEMKNNKAEMQRFTEEISQFSSNPNTWSLSDPLFGFPVCDLTLFHRRIFMQLQEDIPIDIFSIEIKGLKSVNSVMGYLAGNVFLQGVGFQLLKILKDMNLPPDMYSIARRGSSFVIACTNMGEMLKKDIISFTNKSSEKLRDEDAIIITREDLDLISQVERQYESGDPVSSLIDQFLSMTNLKQFDQYPHIPIGIGYSRLNGEPDALTHFVFNNRLSKIYIESNQSYFENLLEQIDLNHFLGVLNEAYNIVAADKEDSKSVQFLFFTHQLVKPQSESESKFVYAVLFMIKRLGNAEGFLHALQKKKSQQDQEASVGVNLDEMIFKYKTVYEFMKKEASKKETKIAA